MAIRHGDWKLVRYDTAADGNNPGTTGFKLYNLKDDIGEKTDLAAKNPEKVKELQSLYKAWNEEQHAPLWQALGAGKAKKKGKN